MDEPKRNIRNKVLFFTVFTVVLACLLWGSYWLLGRFLKDRHEVVSHTSRPLRLNQRTVTNQPQTKRYTPEELAEARRKGQVPPGLQKPVVQPPIQSQDAVQRSMKTIQEINKINEMNRRLMEQQQRMQNR